MAGWTMEKEAYTAHGRGGVKSACTLFLPEIEALQEPLLPCSPHKSVDWRDSQLVDPWRLGS